MFNRRKIERTIETNEGPCACCGTKGALRMQAREARDARETTDEPPQGAAAPVTLCAGCIVALARALAEER